MSWSTASSRVAQLVHRRMAVCSSSTLAQTETAYFSRINGFTYVKTDYDFFTGELKVVETKPFSDGERAAVKCYGANDVLEGVASMPPFCLMA